MFMLSTIEKVGDQTLIVRLQGETNSYALLLRLHAN